MKTADGLSQNLQDALNNGVLKRLPLTFLPFVNEQLQKWQYLFPNERRSVQGLLLYVDSLSPQQSFALFKNVVQLEEKMDVRHWQFSTTEQTIQNSSQLARSPWFLEWRQAVQAVFDTVDQQSPQSKSSSAKRLVLLDIPRPLPLNPATAWRRWQGIGKPLHLQLDKDSVDPFEFLLAGVPSSSPNRSSSADTWVIDAGSSAVNAVLKRTPEFLSKPTSILLSYERLSSYRENFSHEMNTMRKDLADADAVFDRLRTVDVTPWSPPEVSADPAVREFVRSLYLSGNGAVIFGNSFVEWGASEAFRRARPSFLAAKFGVRAKPKPFTGVAVFDNPDKVNPAPSVDDLPGSAADAEILALYVWLAAQRFNEYQHSTVCVCLAESTSQAYLIAPTEFTAAFHADTASLPQLSSALATWIS
ncbi:hypothetical protein P8935_00430 [Telmatobacter sp. DSM 110680]|uniref:Uncharacterized protein n=1 Tax=Telmatobacter sp. DSM 110680 TaxID=3036704 RepID=A0AAU7DJ91_9BACT